MKRAKRYLGKFQYMRILETHKDGTLHIHFLASVHCKNQKTVTRKNGSTYTYDKVLKQHAVDCGFGYICEHKNLVDIDESGENNWSSASVAVYCTKYITKDLADNDQLRKDLRIRKIQTSRGIKRVNLDSSEKWELKSAIQLSEFKSDDRIYHDVTTGHVINEGYFMGGTVYPPDEEWELRKIDKDTE